MKRLLPALLAIIGFPLSTLAQSVPSPGEMAQVKPPPPADDTPPATTPAASVPSSKNARASAAETQAIIDRLTRTNADLLDLLKKQQAVLEDIQYDRRLQNRQITLIEQRLEDTLQLNAELQAKVANLEATAAAAATTRSPSAPDAGEPVKTDEKTAVVTPAPPPPPASYLPPEETGGAPGTMWWHRVVAIAGDDSKNSDPFHVSGKQWRVLWHNQDRPGVMYKNTSALFISAFPVNDTIPKKICSRLGTGGDSTELTGSGDYYLKVEASGGHWELVVEDFR
jgi:TolA-binding protein